MQNLSGLVSLHEFCISNSTQSSFHLPLPLTILSSTLNETGIFGVFSRRLSRSSPDSLHTTPGLTSDFRFAYSTDPSTHYLNYDTQGKGILVLEESHSIPRFFRKKALENYGDAQFDYYRDHGEMMTTMWVGVIQMAIIIIRYFKWWRYSGLMHGILGFVALIFTLVSAYKTYHKDELPLEYLRFSSDLLHHSRIAHTICALTMSQFVLGIFTKYLLIGRQNVRLGTLARLLHLTIGRCIPLLAFVNIKYGWTLHQDTEKLHKFVYPCYGVLAALICILEIWHRWGHRLNALILEHRTHKFVTPRESMSRSGGMSLLGVDGIDKRHVDILMEIKETKREWMFYDEYILDVSGFKWNHPGGSFFFPQVYGQDAGKFINGCSSVNDTIRPYTHSKIAKNMINFLKIGRVAYPTGVLTKIQGAETQASMRWVLADNTMVSAVTNCLEFCSSDWELCNDPPGYEWMGKHFLVTSKIQRTTISRYYSLVIVNLAVWAESARKLGYACKDYRMKKQGARLRLYVKEYPGGIMSEKLCQMDTGSEIELKGPIGPGLCLQNLLEKDYLIFGAGTGILPFLDLVYRVWMERVNKCRLHVYVSFKREEEGFALDLLQATAKQHPHVMKLCVRNGPEGFDLNGEFWRNYLPLKAAERAWICGPPVFNMKVKQILLAEGVDMTKIIVM